jgi:hypothetical protein
MALMPYAAVAAVPLFLGIGRGTLPCTPPVSLPDETIRGSLTRASLRLRFTTMVSAGPAGAHVQPVLEIRELLASSYWLLVASS